MALLWWNIFKAVSEDLQWILYLSWCCRDKARSQWPLSPINPCSQYHSILDSDAMPCLGTMSNHRQLDWLENVPTCSLHLGSAIQWFARIYNLQKIHNKYFISLHTAASFKVKRIIHIWDFTSPLKQNLLDKWGFTPNFHRNWNKKLLVIGLCGIKYFHSRK
jgi:hypothetical protein